VAQRVLVVAPHLGALTPLANQLEELGARGNHVHIAVEGEPPPGVDVQVFAGKFRRVTISSAPLPASSAVLGSTARAVLDCWRFLPDREDGGSAYRRALEQAPTLAARLAGNAFLRSDAVRPLAVWLLTRLDRALPPPAAIVRFLKALRPDLLVAVPLFTIGSSAADYLRAARALGIATFGVPLRWDDLTHGAALHAQPDCLALWNRDDRNRVIKDFGVPARRTVVTGVPLPLDATGTMTMTRAELCGRYGLDPGRPLVVFAPHCSDANRLELYTSWMRVVRCSDNARLRSAQIIVYWPPPGHLRQRERGIDDAVVVPRVGTPPNAYRLEISEVLHHADAIVATDMTLVLEAAARAVPLIALLWPDGGDRDLERFCVAQGGTRDWPCAARSLDDHCAQLAHVLAGGVAPAQRNAVLARVRPHGPSLTPGFLSAARLFREVIDRRAAPTPARYWSLRRGLYALPGALAAWRSATLPARREPGRHAHVLIAVPGNETLQLHLRLLQTLVERGHRVRLVFTARRSRTADYYTRVKTDVPGIESAGVLMPPDGFWARIAAGLLGLSAFAAQLDGRQQRPSPRWLVRYASVVLPPGARRLAWLARNGEGTPARLRRLVASLDRAIAPSRAARDLLLREKPDVVVMLPEPDLVSGFDSAESQADLLRGSTSLGIHAVAIATAADSHLHATMLQPGPAQVFVWNDAQKAEVVQALRIAADRVVVSGAVLLEHALGDPPVVGADQFREMLGLPPRPFALYVGSPGPVIDVDGELDLVRRWIRALRSDTRLALRTLPVLLRPPANRIGRWQTLDFSADDGVVMCPRDYDRTGELNMVLMSESVRYAAVTVGCDGHALTLAAMLGRPGVAMTPMTAGSAASSVPLDWIWTSAGTTVRPADTIEALNAHVLASLETPPTAAPGALLAQVRPGGGHRPTLTAADAIERAARQSPRYQRSRTSWRGVLSRAPLLMGAGLIAMVARLEPSK
jgi:hypothetical protein